MVKKQINVVWLKRDIRSQDHRPLHQAEESDIPYLIIFVFEPLMMDYPDTSLRHLQFQYQALIQLNKKLNAFNRAVIIFYSDIATALDSIREQFYIVHLFSYQESGIQVTYDRDKLVKNYCQNNHIVWMQFQRDGIVRGIKNRTGWDKQWYATMHSPAIINHYTVQEPFSFDNVHPLTNKLIALFTAYPSTYQPAGEDFAIKY